MKVPAGIRFRSMPTLFVSNVPSGEAVAATEDSGGVADDGDDSSHPVRSHVVTRQVSHKFKPCRIEISLRKVG